MKGNHIYVFEKRMKCVTLLIVLPVEDVFDDYDNDEMLHSEL